MMHPRQAGEPMPTEHPFAKDFGYLGKFLANVKSFAEGLDSADTRQQLLTLLEGEPERWKAIDRLLSGSAPTADRADSTAPKHAETSAAPDEIISTDPPLDQPPGWTIGPMTGTNRPGPSGSTR